MTAHDTPIVVQKSDCQPAGFGNQQYELGSSIQAWLSRPRPRHLGPYIRAWISRPGYPGPDVQAGLSGPGYPRPDIQACTSGAGYIQGQIPSLDIQPQISGPGALWYPSRCPHVVMLGGIAYVLLSGPQRPSYSLFLKYIIYKVKKQQKTIKFTKFTFYLLPYSLYTSKYLNIIN